MRWGLQSPKMIRTGVVSKGQEKGKRWILFPLWTHDLEKPSEWTTKDTALLILTVRYLEEEEINSPQLSRTRLSQGSERNNTRYFEGIRWWQTGALEGTGKAGGPVRGRSDQGKLYGAMKGEKWEVTEMTEYRSWNSGRSQWNRMWCLVGMSSIVGTYLQERLLRPIW